MPSINSSSLFGNTSNNNVFDKPASIPDVPMSLGKSTASSFARRTAWRTRESGGSAPLSYSNKTRGTTLSFDDDSSTPPIKN